MLLGKYLLSIYPYTSVEGSNCDKHESPVDCACFYSHLLFVSLSKNFFGRLHQVQYYHWCQIKLVSNLIFIWLWFWIVNDRVKFISSGSCKNCLDFHILFQTVSILERLLLFVKFTMIWRKLSYLIIINRNYFERILENKSIFRYM